MNSFLLVSRDPQKIHAWIATYCKKYSIEASRRVLVVPAGREYSIEQIRELKKDLSFSHEALSIYVLQDFDRSSLEAQNAFLKTLEEHQSKITFILTASNQYSLLPTIVSRCVIISLGSTQPTPKNYVRVQKELDSYLAKGDLSALGGRVFDVKTYEDPQQLFLCMMLFFKSNLAIDTASSKILQEILRLSSLVRYNNVVAQQAVDAILLFIKGTAHKKGYETFT